MLTNFNIQKLPDQDLCGIIKDILQENEDSIREYEIRKDYNGLIQSKKLFISKNWDLNFADIQRHVIEKWPKHD